MRRVARLAFAALIGACLPAYAAELSAAEQKMVQYIDAHAAESNQLLEKLVDINSGTFNVDGVRKVAAVLRPEFEALGFKIRWIPMDDVHRAGHLVAERTGTHGKRVLLIGHMDTVFEPSSPFQKFEPKGDTAAGPGSQDMKGGLVIMLYSLKALQAAGALDGSITVFLTGDEEHPGDPVSIARRDLVAAARQNDIALEYEAGARSTATIARRSSSLWTLRTTGVSAHSSGVFGEGTGSGAIYELARILSAFHDQLREPDLTYNVGVALGGTAVNYDAKEGTGTASGKQNIVPGTAVASGDIRTIDDAQLQRVRDKMRAIVAKHLPRTGAEITFEDLYPSMPATPGNQRLLDQLNAVNRELAFPTMEPLPPGRRGAGDLSFAGPHLDALSGMGSLGRGAHAEGETIDLKSQPMQMKRSALLIYRLTR
ncbi:MAG TPA: M20/M25/M40 family metallo-hydrolase [Verrucomicrobiae bacterium]|nr:M20/M25/M40 family metallo-hydrolase [Verrucomicrobiae bacterium]